MEDKTAKEISKQLTRIANALEAANKREDVVEKRNVVSEKRKAKLESLQVMEIRKNAANISS